MVRVARERGGGTRIPRVRIVFQVAPGKDAAGVRGLRWRVRTVVDGAEASTTTTFQRGTTGADGEVEVRLNPDAREIALELLGEAPDPADDASEVVWASYPLALEDHLPSEADRHGVAKRLSALGYLGSAQASDVELREAIAHYLSDCPARGSPEGLNDVFDPGGESPYARVSADELWTRLGRDGR